MNLRWFTAPLIIVVILLGWQILTAGRSFVPLDGEEAWDLWATEQVTVLDVSEQTMFERRHIPGSVNVEIGDLRGSLDSWNKDDPVLVVSTRGSRSAAAANLLIVTGFQRVYHLQGGLQNWPGPTETR